MQSYNDVYYDPITPIYRNLIEDEIKEKNIIFIHQYIRDIDKDFDREYGYIYTWIIGIICIEKLEDEYIFHTFETNMQDAMSEPYYIEKDYLNPSNQEFIIFSNKYSITLSSLLSEPINHYYFGNNWWLYYTTAKLSEDEILINKMKPKRNQVFRYERNERKEFLSKSKPKITLEKL